MPRRLYILLLCYLSPLFAYSQSSISFPPIDQYARNTPKKWSTNLDSLTVYLMKGANDELEQVRRFFAWTVYHIEFDHKAYKKGQRRINHSIEDILQRKKAVCFGYSQLLQAFFLKAGIRSEIIAGYSKTSEQSLPNLSAPDHSWNAVRIDGQWHLLDATWSRSATGTIDTEQSFFLTPPKQFVRSHLPEDPVWQLLDFPISLEQFNRSAFNTTVDSSQFMNYRDSIAKYEQMSRPLRKLYHAIKGHQLNPRPLVARELSAAYLDYESVLNERAEYFQAQGQYDSLLLIQREMIELCQRATHLADLFPGQAENCAYNHFNYAVALAANLQNRPSKDRQLKHYEEMLTEFELAHEQLSQLKRNFFIEGTLEKCNDYINYCRGRIEVVRD